MSKVRVALIVVLVVDSIHLDRLVLVVAAGSISSFRTYFQTSLEGNAVLNVNADLRAKASRYH